MSRIAVQETIAGIETDCIEIGEKKVEMEDGEIERVSPFVITRELITFAHFRTFVKATGYMSTAEKQDWQTESWKFNCMIEGLGDKEISELPVMYVSYHDAIAFCEWSGWRLPTDIEWMAASLIDDRIVDEKTYDRLFGFEGSMRPFPKTFLSTELSEITGTLFEDEFCVERGQPVHLRVQGWNKIPRFNEECLRELDRSSDSSCFRVCKSF